MCKEMSKASATSPTEVVESDAPQNLYMIMCPDSNLLKVGATADTKDGIVGQHLRNYPPPFSILYIALAKGVRMRKAENIVKLIRLEIERLLG